MYFPFFPSFFFLTPCVAHIISLIRVNPTLSSLCLDKTIELAVELRLKRNPSDT